MAKILFLIAALLVYARLSAQEAKLTVESDAPVRITVDGKELGILQPGTPRVIDLAPGDRQVQAVAEGGGPAWIKAVNVSSALPNSLSIPMQAHLRRAEIQRAGYWADDRTGLIWAASDSGSGVTVSQAHLYCKQLQTGGFRDWRLPRINELQTLFGGPADERGFRLVAPLKLSGWSWSANQGDEPAENWSLDLGDGARASVAAGDAGLNRALCVRNMPRPL